MLVAVVGDLAAGLEDRLPAALADEPDAVHRLRTAVRRLRNVLAAFASYLEPGEVGALRAGLAEYGDRLGVARDVEVRAEWCARVAADVGLDAALTERIMGPLRAEHDVAQASLVRWAGSPEAGRLREALSSWAASPALVDGRSARPAAAVAQDVLAAQVERVLAHGEDHLADEESLHGLRRAGRRLRHTADAVTRPPAGVLGADARAVGDLGGRLQSLLGDHRDAHLLAEHVRASVPDAAERSPYEPLVEAAERVAASTIDAVPPVLAELRALSEARAKVAGWTSGSAS